MAIARSETVDPLKEGTYHCWSRCVRRAFLCGFDALTGKNYDHRKEWVVRRMEYLVGIFAIDVLAYAVMDNHKHLILRNCPKEAISWSPREVVIRWYRLFPKRRDETGAPEEPSEVEIAEVTQDPKRVEELRKRLCDISWFMRCLKENIARRANIEDEVTGRFWEGRFKCTRLDDDAAVLSCMTYVDLNPIRAGKADRPEDSKFTSAYKRLHEKKSESWLCPIERTLSKRSKFVLEEYLVVLDRTGREMVKGKRGCIPEELRPILERVSINPENWLSTSRNFGRLFPRVAGRVERMRDAAEVAGRQWFKGLSAAVKCF